MPCEECQALNTHRFGSLEDLINALQVAAAEADRGVLRQANERKTTIPEQEALESVFASGALPDNVSYRFSCAVCGDRFELLADTRQGSGAWIRNDEQPAASKPNSKPNT
jgi:hypothetical protein